ncbi:hypothetical protein SAMN04488029_0019 [Reichenbachiella faecimaris]|uniref:Uncharacterized protein n=1 Tax=Reichenbachiella faecimaris TaxID=692418 RepID=A0A1W2G5T8_REIFA|nr:hypothetical protein [Reichenbachiella faecimaris]SMD31656.1 hypothetical protein SAMN04488029_0019 [Reichenbachiella faecimaris]
MDNNFDIFVDHWHQVVVIWSQILLGCSVLILMYYFIVLNMKRSLVEQYNFISTNEIKYLWYAGMSLSLTFAFFLNSSIVRVHVTRTEFILGVKTFVSLIIGLLFASAIKTYLNVYYPFRLEKRLNKLRFRSRISPKTGVEMRLLTEKEEDVHLTKEMIEHENIRAYEYDVWLDETNGEKIIEKYEVNRHLIICNECNYRTARDIKEEVVKEPSETEQGEMMKHYECSYCGHRQQKKSPIAALSTN